jgi:hypothetical protein
MTAPSIPLYKNLSISTLAAIYADLRDAVTTDDNSSPIAACQVDNLLRYVRGLGVDLLHVFESEVGRLICTSDDRNWPDS